ncbi:MAG: NAD(P)/FAD-dependent oxidoreductase [Candidatus Hadarchaeales archaeon]
MKTDVVIVGGGPAGCFLAKLLSENEIDVIVVEEHAEIGNPVCCAGIVGINGLKEIGIRPGRWVLGKLRRAKIYPPSGAPVEIGKKEPVAYVIDRAELDRTLAMEAARAGARFLLKTRCTAVKSGQPPQIKVTGEISGKISASLVVGADGPASVVWRSIETGKPASYVNCAQVEISGHLPKDVAEIYLGRRFFSGFFGWGVKAGKMCRVGLGCSEGNPANLLSEFLKTHPAAMKFLPTKETHFCAGAIPPPFLRKISGNGVMLVGDAAGQVKPLTGGGIYLGLSSAKIAADVISRSKWRNAPKEYNSAVMKKFSRGIELERRAATIMKRVSDEEISAVVKILEEKEIREICEERFDFDKHGELIKALLPKVPALLRRVGATSLLKNLITFLRG